MYLIFIAPCTIKIKCPNYLVTLIESSSLSTTLFIATLINLKVLSPKVILHTKMGWVGCHIIDMICSSHKGQVPSSLTVQCSPVNCLEPIIMT